MLVCYEYTYFLLSSLSSRIALAVRLSNNKDSWLLRDEPSMKFDHDAPLLGDAAFLDFGDFSANLISIL